MRRVREKERDRYRADEDIDGDDLMSRPLFLPFCVLSIKIFSRKILNRKRERERKRVTIGSPLKWERSFFAVNIVKFGIPPL